MKKCINGIIVGIVAGIINCLFLLFASDIEITVYISTIITWAITGLIISSTNFKLKGILKGIIISVLISLPSFVFTISSTLFGTIWTLGETILFGAIIGYVIEKTNN